MLPQETINKANLLSTEKTNAVINFIDQLALTSDPLNIFEALCNDGAKNPLSDEEINSFVSEVRKERLC